MTRRLAAFGLIGFGGSLALVLLHAPLLRAIGRGWALDETPALAAQLRDGPTGAIVILAGSTFSRPHHAAKLFHEGVAERIVITDVRADPAALLLSPELDYAIGTLFANRVPKDALVLLEAPVASTWDEAVVVADWARETAARSIVVVTDPLHTRRSRWTFRTVFAAREAAGGVAPTVHVVAAETRDYEVDRWWCSEVGLITLQNEVIKFAWYRWRALVAPPSG